jgi:hypothetical protein
LCISLFLCLLKWSLVMYIPIVRFRLYIGMEDQSLPTCGGNACLSMFINFDTGSFLVGQIVESHNHGTNSQISKYRGPKPLKVPIFKCGLVWKNGEWYGGTNKLSIECAYISHACVYEFLEGEWSDLHTPIEQNILENVHVQKNIKNSTIKHHLRHTS